MATRKRPVSKTKKPPVELETRSASQTLVSFENNTSSRRRLITYGLLALLVIGGLLYAFRTQLLAATVNGEMISRWKLIKQLEKQNGSQALDNLVVETLIMQEAKKKGVAVSDAELEEEIKKIEERFKTQGQELDQVLVTQG